ncbi:hypothetical protein KAU40_00475 [Candidatus Parcubacteria bacterium]|nr:hypothetical protein [Candidatus Parcubacteria bacterium]
MFLIQWKHNKKGIAVIEILIIIVIITTALTALLGLVAFSLRASVLIKETTQAKNIAEGIIEQTRNFRDGTIWDTDGLGVLSTGIIYHIEKTTDALPKWQIVAGEETIDGFTRKVIFGEVQRDGDDNIVETEGTIDSDTKKITAAVSWQTKGKTRQIEIITFLTNWKQ